MHCVAMERRRPRLRRAGIYGLSTAPRALKNPISLDGKSDFLSRSNEQSGLSPAATLAARHKCYKSNYFCKIKKFLLPLQIIMHYALCIMNFIKLWKSTKYLSSTTNQTSAKA